MGHFPPPSRAFCSYSFVAPKCMLWNCKIRNMIFFPENLHSSAGGRGRPERRIKEKPPFSEEAAEPYFPSCINQSQGSQACGITLKLLQSLLKNFGWMRLCFGGRGWVWRDQLSWFQAGVVWADIMQASHTSASVPLSLTSAFPEFFHIQLVTHQISHLIHCATCFGWVSYWLDLLVALHSFSVILFWVSMLPLLISFIWHSAWIYVTVLVFNILMSRKLKHFICVEFCVLMQLDVGSFCVCSWKCWEAGVSWRWMMHPRLKLWKCWDWGMQRSQTCSYLENGMLQST